MNDDSADKLGSIFVDALTTVLSTMSGCSFDVLSSEIDSSFYEMVGIMSFNGKRNGMVFISAEETSMRILCSYMAGIPNNEVTKDDMEDALCEFVNMTAGNAKLLTNNTEQMYTLSPPFVINGKNMSIMTKKRVDVISRVLGDSEISVKLKVMLY